MGQFFRVLSRCFGVESGVSIIDYDGSLERKVDEYVAEFPDVSFELVFDKFLKSHEGSLSLHQISLGALLLRLNSNGAF